MIGGLIRAFFTASTPVSGSYVETGVEAVKP
jgi:hypothetical protein